VNYLLFRAAEPNLPLPWINVNTKNAKKLQKAQKNYKKAYN
jgi:hypothetical protein